MRYRYRNGKREYIYGDPPRVARFCLGPFQDAVLWACKRKKRSGYRRARRVTPKLAARQYGVDLDELNRWRREAA